MSEKGATAPAQGEPLVVLTPRKPSVLFRAITGLWLALAFVGFVIALGGLSRLQRDINGDPGSATAQWSINANLPNLTQGRVIRFDWFTLFLELTVWVLVLLVLASTALEQARASVVGLLAVTTVLQVLSTDRMYNIRSFRSFTPASCAFAGFVIMSVADFALLYQLGLQHVGHTQL